MHLTRQKSMFYKILCLAIFKLARYKYKKFISTPYGSYISHEYCIYAYGIYTVFSPLPYGIMDILHTVLPYLGAGSTVYGNLE